MVDNWSIHPVHGNLSAFNTTSNHTSLVNFYAASNKAFTNLTNFATGSSHTTMNPSGYVYLISKPTDGQGMTETVMRKISRTIHEVIGSSDSASKKEPSTDLDGQGMTETVIRTVYRTVHECIGSADVAQAAHRLIKHYTVNINGVVRATIPHTVHIGLKSRLTKNYAVTINGIPSNVNGSGAPTQLVAATSATGTDYLGNSNPFNATLVIDSSVIYGTAPPQVSGTGIYIDIPNTGTNSIGNPALNWSDLFNFGMSMNYAGGTFSIGSQAFFGNIGDILNVFGLQGTLTDGGYRISNTMKGYTSNGIFGNPLLNKQFQLIANSSSLFKFLNSAQISSSGFGQTQAGITVRSAAAEVASICGIHMNWYGQDLPLTDFSYEPSMNGMSALNSLAQRVGCTLRCYGNDTYYVATPNVTIGEFVIPSGKLISAVGLEGASHLDLETGIGGAVNINSYGTPAVTLSPVVPPGFSIAGAGSYQLPAQPFNNGFTSPIVPVSGPITKLLAKTDTPLYYNLPSQYNTILCQVLIPPTYNPSGQYVTTDPNVWDIFVEPDTGDAAITADQLGDPVNGIPNTSEYVFQIYQGGAYVKKIKIDYLCFPTHPAVQAGQFTMQIGALVNSPTLPPLNPNQIPSYVQTFKGTINCVFFGVIPLPGMFVTATVDNLTVSGVIENVSFSSPGFLQLDVAQYTRIVWNVPYLQNGANI